LTQCSVDAAVQVREQIILESLHDVRLSVIEFDHQAGDKALGVPGTHKKCFGDEDGIIFSLDLGLLFPDLIEENLLVLPVVDNAALDREAKIRDW
jgi:hypothetical protein